jgi:hypothetical protein
LTDLWIVINIMEHWPMSSERDFFTLKGEKFTFSNNLWSKNPFAKVEKIPFAKESRSDDMGHCFGPYGTMEHYFGPYGTMEHYFGPYMTM